MVDNKKTNIEESETEQPICEKCDNAMLMEEGEWVCPHCQGEIDFLGEGEEDES